MAYRQVKSLVEKLHGAHLLLAEVLQHRRLSFVLRFMLVVVDLVQCLFSFLHLLHQDLEFVQVEYVVMVCVVGNEQSL